MRVISLFPPALFVKKLSFSIKLLWHICQKSSSFLSVALFLKFILVSFICLSILRPIPHWFEYFCFSKHWKQCVYPYFILFLTYFFSLLVLCICIYFLETACQSVMQKKKKGKIIINEKKNRNTIFFLLLWMILRWFIS